MIFVRVWCILDSLDQPRRYHSTAYASGSDICKVLCLIENSLYRCPRSSLCPPLAAGAQKNSTERGKGNTWLNHRVCVLSCFCWNPWHQHLWGLSQTRCVRTQQHNAVDCSPAYPARHLTSLHRPSSLAYNSIFGSLQHEFIRSQAYMSLSDNHERPKRFSCMPRYSDQGKMIWTSSVWFALDWSMEGRCGWSLTIAARSAPLASSS